MLEHVLHDVRYAVRLLRKTPGFTAVAVLTLALGIGVNSAIFSVIDGVMLRPLPYADADRLVSLWEARVGRDPADATSSGAIVGGGADPGRMVVSPANLVDYQTQAKGFTSLAAFAQVSVTLTGAGTPQQIPGEDVTRNYFDVLRASPALGRLPNDADVKQDARPIVC